MQRTATRNGRAARIGLVLGVVGLSVGAAVSCRAPAEPAVKAASVWERGLVEDDGDIDLFVPAEQLEPERR